MKLQRQKLVIDFESFDEFFYVADTLCVDVAVTGG